MIGANRRLQTGPTVRYLLGLALVFGLALMSSCSSDPDPTAESGQPDAALDIAGSVEEPSVNDPDIAASPQLASTAPFEVIVAEATVDKVTARFTPDADGEAIVELDNPTAMGGPLVFQLIGTSVDPSQQWVEVKLPIRPNGSTGWIRLSDVSLSRNPYRIEIDAAAYQLRVYREKALWLSTAVAIGTGETPTPRGNFYITELLQPPNPDGLYGPFAFGLSGFSESLQSFRGGEAVIGIHGTDEPEALGTDVSHGCVRVANEVIIEMAAVIPLGTPVEIVG